MIRTVNAATRHPLDVAKRQTGLLIGFAECRHKRFVGLPDTKPSAILGTKRECGCCVAYKWAGL